MHFCTTFKINFQIIKKWVNPIRTHPWSDSLPGIPRMAVRHSWEPCLTSDSMRLRRGWRQRVRAYIIHSRNKKSQPSGWDFSFWSGRRGSNSLPPPWQGGALPDELRPRNIGYFNKSTGTCQYVFPNFRFFYSAASSAAPQVISRMQLSPSCTPAG